MAGPSPLHSPLIPVSMPSATPCCSEDAFLLTRALIAGYMIDEMAANTPANHINLRVWE